jgi:hypothetical protein
MNENFTNDTIRKIKHGTLVKITWSGSGVSARPFLLCGTKSYTAFGNTMLKI